ncbi:uncharacterized protein EDB91DRAFT_294819 [Suillus paluster]|uniref:uncharacterized protein n=1 Tax=Suillus paluster TaxID=48578 RepID=UPI001B86F300|nr:uncharacterized protein EDB91DRAFT_294819 [Suillus paluster]KAG1742728.1 hypothetical protein EDB91DRAFT_294819 [Suillus paluster]
MRLSNLAHYADLSFVLNLLPPDLPGIPFNLRSFHYDDSSPMSAWQNPHMHRGEWRREKPLDFGNHHFAILNLFRNGTLAFYVFLQLAIFAAASWFAILVRTRGPITLPSGVADVAMKYPRITSYGVTLIATVISFLNMVLLSSVLQIALTARMTQPLSLQALRGGFSLVTGQTLLGVRGLKIAWAWIKSLACMSHGENIGPSDRLYWRWLKYTLMYAMLCGPLTSSWTSFLTPTPVELQFKFGGPEVDYVAAPAQLQARWNGYVAPYPSDTSPLVTYMNATRGMQGYGLRDATLFTQAGNAAAANELGSPYYIPFYGALYNGSTGGIFTNALMTGQDARPSIPSEYTGWTPRYTTVQQGFSAEVRCRQQSFINAVGVYPSVSLYDSASSGTSIAGPNGVVPADYSIKRWLMITNCSSDSVAYTSDILEMVDPNGSSLGDGVLIGSVCKYQDFEKATNQSFLVLMQGFDPSYSFITPTICEVSPRITSVEVDFDGTTVNIHNTTNSESLDPEGQQAAYIDQISDLIWEMMFVTQSLAGNSMAAGIQMVGYAHDGSLTLDSVLLNFVLENYLRGAIEFLGTFWRMDLQHMNNTSMTQYTGIVHVKSLGYEYQRLTFLLLLVPLAMVVFLTCAAAVYTPAAKPKKPGYVSLVEVGSIQDNMYGPLNHAPRSSFADSEDFDPINIIHLMMLASRARLENEAGQNELFQFALD